MYEFELSSYYFCINLLFQITYKELIEEIGKDFVRKQEYRHLKRMVKEIGHSLQLGAPQKEKVKEKGRSEAKEASFSIKLKHILSISSLRSHSNSIREQNELCIDIQAAI